MKLRDAVAVRSQTERDQAKRLATAVVHVAIDNEPEGDTTDTVRAMAVALAAARQLYLATGHLSAKDLSAAMPVIEHMSLIAEGLVDMSDDMSGIDMWGSVNDETDAPPELDEWA